MVSYEIARQWYAQADAKRWQVAAVAFRVVGLRTCGETLRLAEAIGRGVDTVENLAYAYTLFAELIRYKKTTESIRQLRRKFPYTRWAVICKQWLNHEFELDEALDWLENFSGGNAALSAEIENKHGSPEWERRAYMTYKQAYKLQTDFGVPDKLHKAAIEYVKAFEDWEKDL